MTRELPLLAPLLDSLTTRHIAKRLTAAQAVSFLDAQLAKLSPKELSKPAYPRPPELIDPLDYDDNAVRWQGLPSSFLAEWERDWRVDEVPMWVRLVRDVYVSGRKGRAVVVYGRMLVDSVRRTRWECLALIPVVLGVCMYYWMSAGRGSMGMS